MKFNHTENNDDSFTDWLAGSDRPRREGVYLRGSPAGPYSCWSGKRWFSDASTPAKAAMQQHESPYQSAPWRGLKNAPAAPCWACRGHGVIDRGYDSETKADLIEECVEC